MATVSGRVIRVRQNAVATAGLVVLAVGVGRIAGARPSLAVALAAAIVFGLIVLQDLSAGVCLFLLVAFLDVVSHNADLSLTKAAGVVLAGSWLAAVATRRVPGPDLVTQAPWLVVVIIAFVAWSGFSAIWAEDPGAALRSTLRFGLNAMLVPIVLCAVRERRHVVSVLAVFVVGSLLSVLWGVTQDKLAGGSAAGQVGRLSGATVEANVLAMLLVVSMIFAGTLVIVQRRQPVVQVLAGIAAIAAITAFFGTFSRGGLVAMAVAVLVGCVYGGRSRPVFIALVLGAALIGSVYLRDSTSVAAARLGSTNSSGRVDIWKVGVRMVRAHPVAGVGSGNYTIAEPHYLLNSHGTIAHVALILDRPHVAHNVYLHVLAEMGVVGLALFLSFIALAMRCAMKAVSIFRRRGERSMELMGRAIVVALAGILAADFFLSEQYSKQLWLLLAMGPALLSLARRGSAAADDLPRRT